MSTAPPEIAKHMRMKAHKYGTKMITVAMGLSTISGLAFYYGFVKPKYNRYVDYFESCKGDGAYKMLEKICAKNPNYLHTCPENLAKRFQEKGLPVPK